MDYLKKDLRIFKFILMVVFIVGLISHGYFFSNSVLSHDALWAVDANADLELKISSGRFMQYLIFTLRGWYSVPWIIGIMSLFWISCSVYIITKTYNLKSIVSIVFVSIILVLNTSNIITIATYTHEADTYQLALLFALLATYVSKFKYGYIASTIFIIFSLGIYQSFISVIVVGFVLLSVLDVLNNKDFKDILIHGISRILIILAGCILYLGVMKLIISLCGYELVDRATSILNIDFNIVNFKNTFDRGKYYFANPISHTMEARKIIAFCYSVFNVILLYNLIILTIARNLKKINIVLMAILAFIFIFSMNIMYFIDSSTYYEIMYYGNLFLLFFGIILIEKASDLKYNIKVLKLNQVIRVITFVLLGIVYFNNFIFANQVYFKKNTDFISVNSTMTRIIDDMEDIDGYVMGKTPVLFSDPLSSSAIYSESYDMPSLNSWILTTGIVSIRASYDQYFKNIMKYPINLHEINYQNNIGNERVAFLEFLDMPVFPEKGYMQMVDDVLIIKIRTTRNEATIQESIDLNLIPDIILDNTIDNILVNRQVFCQLLLQTYLAKTGITDDIIDYNAKTPFTDVDDPYITTAYNLGIAFGISDTLFNPEEIITRQDAALMLNDLVKKLNLNSNIPKTEFNDEHIFKENTVEAIYNISTMQLPDGNCIMNGTGGNKFSPSSDYTLEHAIITLNRLYKYNN